MEQVRARDRADQLVNIELRHFVSFAVAGIRNLYPHRRGLSWSDYVRFHSRILEAERGVAEAKTEGEKGFSRRKNVRPIARRLVIVERGKLAHGTRKGDRQFSARIHVTK